MAVPALVTTPGSASANAYIDETEAATYLDDGRLFVTAWSALSSDNQKKAILWATRLLDDCFEWDGTPTYLTQSLRNPRTGLITRDGTDPGSTVIIEPLKRATAELANHLAERDRMGAPALVGLGFSEAKVGPLQVKIDSDQIQEVIPRIVRSILAPYARLVPGLNGGGDGPVSLRRT